MLKAQILVDNTSEAGLLSEWGLSVYITYNGWHCLLDTGASDLYLSNAEALGVSIEDADCAVLSHAHYDHSGGYRSFFEKNVKAKLYISDSCEENCYFKLGPIRRYIGIPRGILNDYSDRIVPVNSLYQLTEGAWLVPHLTDGLGEIGRKAHMYRTENGRTVPDDFSHEQSLVFDTEHGLVVFNSCSHSGLQNILRDLAHFFPDRHIYMTVGGLHFKGMSERRMRQTACTIRQLDIDHIVTGHCTGEKGFAILRSELGSRLSQTSAGVSLEI